MVYYINTDKSETVEVSKVAITVNIYYRGKGGNAKKFAEEMTLDNYWFAERK